jgi:hypothetical protein
MAAHEITDAELNAIEARSDPADIPRIVVALREANADLANPLRLEKAQQTIIHYLQNIQLRFSVDNLPEDCTKVALRIDLIEQNASGGFKLTRRGTRFLRDRYKPILRDI